MTLQKSAALLSCLGTLVVAFQPAQFVDWYFQSSLAVGHWLYVVSGDIYTADFNYAQGVHTLYIFDLSESWTTVDVGPSSIATPADMIDTKQPILWHDPQSDQIGMWAGLPFNWTTWPGSYTIDHVTTGGASWRDAQVPSDNNTGTLLNGLWGSAWCSSKEQLFSLGGYITQDNQNLPVNGMVTHTFSNNTWVNTTSGPPDSRFNVFAQMNFVPNFGDSGLLVLFGGERPPDDLSYTGSPSVLVDMSYIDVYDIEHKQWHTQQAFGDIPDPTTRFSSVGVPAQGNDSFEIFILPGNGNQTFDTAEPNNEAFRDVYILSLPAFQWFRAHRPDTTRRTGHRCQLIGNRSMLVIGGGLFANSDLTKVDPHPNGLGIFDLSTLQWTTTYNATAPAYERPTMVQDYYSENHTVPSWSDAALSTLFPFRASLQTVPDANQTTPANSSTHSPTVSATTTPNTSSSKHGASVGAIVGGVIGGVTALVILGVGLFLWRRRKRAARSPSEHPRPEKSQTQISGNPVHEKDGAPPRHELGPGAENPVKPQSDITRYELS
ncbi:hypothetical protein H2200_004643 [Cladophialophora chaetospira]|uniref:Kelch repeat protein n=1 Tax=Cladophialophora chaetospira TaxID=386627 RepID=A0AA38XE58_9EURO|nr:hypothetical protein H2200_004643 [Cladophialophora chaetospira]